MRHTTLQRLEKLEADNNQEPGPFIIIIRPVADSDWSPNTYRCPQFDMTFTRDPEESYDTFFDRADASLRAHRDQQFAATGERIQAVQLHPVMNID